MDGQTPGEKIILFENLLFTFEKRSFHEGGGSFNLEMQICNHFVPQNSNCAMLSVLGRTIFVTFRIGTII